MYIYFGSSSHTEGGAGKQVIWIEQFFNYSIPQF
jgi:hypothetical protein